MQKLNLPDGFLELTVLSTGQIRARLTEIREGAPVGGREVISCPLIMRHQMPISLCVAWSTAGITLCLNGEFIGSSEHPEPEFNPAERRVRERAKHAPEDFAQKNQAAVNRRRDRLAGWQPVPGRVRATNGDMLTALDEEMHQLADLIEHIRNGRRYHLAGVASRLRLLIATGRPQPLLQLCAAIKQVPLIAYTSSRVERWKGVQDPPPYEMSAVIDWEPTEINGNPIDLDIWLELPWGRMAGKPVSNRQFLKSTGDTIGSHRDFDFLPLVLFPRAVELHFGGAAHDYLISYLLRVTEVTQQLARNLLAIQ